MMNILDRMFGSDLARDALLAHMRDLSEEAYCAGWMMNLEYDLWDELIRGEQGRYRRSVTKEDAARLQSLARRARGWWIWPEGASEPEFVGMRQWKKIMAVRHAH